MRKRWLPVFQALGLALLIAVGILLRPGSWSAWAASAEGSRNPPTAAGEVSEATIANLRAGLDRLAGDVQRKIDNDIDITASAFWYVYDAERARWPVDVFGSVLTAKNVGISTVEVASGKAPPTNNCVLEPPPVHNYEKASQRYGNVTAHWSASCENGLAQGLGTLSWQSEGITFYNEEITGTNGLIMKDGLVVASDAVNGGAVTWQTACNSGRVPSRAVHGLVSTALNLHFRVISDRLLALGVQYLSDKCPHKDKGRMHLHLFQKPSENINISVTTNSDGGFIDFPQAGVCYAGPSWSADSYRNLPCEKRFTDVGTAWSEFVDNRAKERAQQELRAQQEMKREEARRAAERNRQQDAERRSQSEARLGNFLQQTGASALVPLPVLGNNAFRYEGTTVAVHAFYVEMLGRDLSHFQSRGGGFLVVSGLDPKHSMTFGADVMLAGKVTGVHQLNFGLIAPLLDLHGIYVCQIEGCKDIVGSFGLPEQGLPAELPRIEKAALNVEFITTDQTYIYLFDFDFVNALARPIEIISVNVFDMRGSKVAQDFSMSGPNFDSRLLTHELSGDHPLVKNFSKPGRSTRLEQATVSSVGGRAEFKVTNRILLSGQAIRQSGYILASKNKYDSLILRVAYRVNGNLQEVSRTFTVGGVPEQPGQNVPPPKAQEPPGQKVPASAKNWHPAKYVALGDSYSSGEGAILYSWGKPVLDSNGNAVNFLQDTDTNSNQCHRSPNAYPERVKAYFGISDNTFSPLFRACSGAIEAQFFKYWGQGSPSTPPLFGDLSQSPVSGQSAILRPTTGEGGQWTESAQLDTITSDVDLVTLTVGGNDIGFPRILKACIKVPPVNMPSEKDCLSAASNFYNLGAYLLMNGGTIIVRPAKDFPGTTWDFCDQNQECEMYPGKTIRLPGLSAPGGLFQEIHKRAPKAAIRVLLYPLLFEDIPEKIAICKVSWHELATFTGTVTRKLNDIGLRLNEIISDEIKKARAAGIDISAVEPNQAFKGHRLCNASKGIMRSHNGAYSSYDSVDAWMHGFIVQDTQDTQVWSPSPFSFHPNAVGQENLATEVIKTIVDKGPKSN